MESLTVEESLIIYLKLLKQKVDKSKQTHAGSRAVVDLVFVNKSKSSKHPHPLSYTPTLTHNTHIHIQREKCFCFKTHEKRRNGISGNSKSLLSSASRKDKRKTNS